MIFKASLDYVLIIVEFFLQIAGHLHDLTKKNIKLQDIMHDLTKKNIKYVWGSRQEQAIGRLKEKLMTKPLLILPDLAKPFEVQCDACGHNIADVLMQEGHPVSYESQRLDALEQTLGIYEKELIEVIHVLQTWKHY